jgi:hypothetical protein
MKLITETTLDVRVLTEASTDGKKNYFIEGVFMESDARNRNGRVYPMPIMQKEVNRYITEYVNTSRALGELGHPEGPTVNLERAAHMIKELHFDKNQICGRAKVLDTPYGKIVKNLMDEGAKLGVSSRGMGSLIEKNGYQEVQEDFMLAAVDIVADPSAPNAFVNGIMEGREWVLEHGIFKAVDLENAKKQISRSSSRDLEKTKLKVFESFLSKLKKL